MGNEIDGRYYEETTRSENGGVPNQCGLTSASWGGYKGHASERKDENVYRYFYGDSSL
jgi:hypothetical protein